MQTVSLLVRVSRKSAETVLRPSPVRASIATWIATFPGECKHSSVMRPMARPCILLTTVSASTLYRELSGMLPGAKVSVYREIAGV